MTKATITDKVDHAKNRGSIKHNGTILNSDNKSNIYYIHFSAKEEGQEEISRNWILINKNLIVKPVVVTSNRLFFRLNVITSKWEKKIKQKKQLKNRQATTKRQKKIEKKT